MTGSLLRLMFPGGQVPAWHFEVFDHDRNASYSVILLDPVGVAPVERSRVLGNRSADQRYAPQLEQLLALNADFDWACWVHLAPAPHAHILQLQEPLLAAQEELSPYAERTFAIGSGSGRRSSGMLQRTLAALERQLDRLTEGLTTCCSRRSSCMRGGLARVRYTTRSVWTIVGNRLHILIGMAITCGWGV